MAQGSVAETRSIGLGREVGRAANVLNHLGLCYGMRMHLGLPSLSALVATEEEESDGYTDCNSNDTSNNPTCDRAHMVRLFRFVRG